MSVSFDLYMQSLSLNFREGIAFIALWPRGQQEKTERHILCNFMLFSHENLANSCFLLPTFMLLNSTQSGIISIIVFPILRGLQINAILKLKSK